MNWVRRVSEEAQRTVLNAGEFHIVASDVKIEDEPIRLDYHPDRAFLIPVKDLHAETIAALDIHPRVGSVVDKQSLILFRPNKSEHLSLQADEAKEIRQLDFSPNPTALATLKYGLQKFGHAAAHIAIAADDLGLPTTTSEHLDRLLPESYKAALQEAGVEKPLLLSDRVARQLADSHNKRPIQHVKSKGRLNMNGFDVFCSNGQFALDSPAVEGSSCTKIGCAGLENAVGLTKPSADGLRQVPSCGTIIAGEIMDAVRKTGAQKFITVQNVVLDEAIMRKTFDGAVITAFHNPDGDIKISGHFVSGSGSQRFPIREYMQQDWQLAGLRGLKSSQNGQMERR